MLKISLLAVCLGAVPTLAQSDPAGFPERLTTTTTTATATATTETTETTAPAAPADPSSQPQGPAHAEASATAPAAAATAPVTSFAACLALAQGGTQPTPLLLCLDTVVREAPDSIDAVRAAAAKTMVEAALLNPWPAAAPLNPGAPTSDPFGPPGRLELVGIAGLFGVWNGVALALAASPVVLADSANSGGLSLLGTSALALAGGVGFGVGGYFLGDALHLDEDGARLVGSGLLWGSNMGIAGSVLIFDLLKPQGNALLLVALAPIVAMGYVGGGLGLAAAKFGRFDAGQISLLNSGSTMGSILGGMVAINLLAQPSYGVIPPTLAYMLGNASGVLAFGLLGNIVDLTWGQTVIADLGMVLGGTVLGLGTVGALSFLPANAPACSLATPMITGAISVGVVGGYAAGLAIAMAVGGPKTPQPSALSLTPATGAVLDRSGRLTQTMGMVAHF